MHTQTNKGILLSILAVAALMGLFALVNHQPGLSVTVLNPKFRLLDARISYGTTHEVAKDNWPITQLSKLLHAGGVNVVVPIRLPPTPTASHAFVARYTGGFAPNELSNMRAELVDAFGNVSLLGSRAAYVSGRNPNEYGRIWLLNSPLTNGVTIRLRPGVGQVPLAEIRVGSD